MNRRPYRRAMLGAASMLVLAGCAATPPQPSSQRATGTLGSAPATETVRTPAATADAVATPLGSMPRTGERITVDPPVTRADEAASIRLSGFEPGTDVTVDVTTVGEPFEDPDGTHGPEEASATFVTDAGGNVDVDTQVPKPGGSYDIANGMGLFWSVPPVSSPSVPTTVEPLAD